MATRVWAASSGVHSQQATGKYLQPRPDPKNSIITRRWSTCTQVEVCPVIKNHHQQPQRKFRLPSCQGHQYGGEIETLTEVLCHCGSRRIKRRKKRREMTTQKPCADLSPTSSASTVLPARIAVAGLCGAM